MVWLPRTEVGDGDAPGREDAPAIADALAVAAGGVGDPDCAADGEAAAGVTVGPTPAVAVAGTLDVAVAALGDALATVDDGLALVRVAAVLSATPPVDAANTAAPTARRPTTARIGTSGTRGARGERVRQFGQKPETGVNR